MFDGKFCPGINVRLAENYADVSRDEPLARAAPGLQEPAVASSRQTIMPRVGMAPHWAIHTKRGSSRRRTRVSGHPLPCLGQQRGARASASRGQGVDDSASVPTRPRAMPGSSSRARKAEQELPNLRPAHLQNCTLRGAGAGEGLQRTVMNWQALCFSTLPPSSGTHRSRSRSRRRRDRDDKKGRRSNDDEALRFFAQIVL